MATPIYGFDDMPGSQLDRETPHNNGIYSLEQLISGILDKDLTGGGPVTLSVAEWEYGGFTFSGTPGAAVTVNLGAIQSVKGYVNNSGQTVNLTRGSTIIALLDTEAAVVITDGTTNGAWRAS